MCGITGILSQTNPVQTIVESMTQSLQHRGPDSSGYYIQSDVALGHRRLSIIDLSEQGNQPMCDDSGTLVIVYNGELYNYQTLRDKLKAHYSFHTNSDTEVILAAFKIWGPKCLNEFNGIFAFAIWNTVTRKLFIARDHLGIKPLYYYRSENFFLFASEIRGLLASNIIDRKISRQGLVDFLSYQSVHEPSSMIKGAYQLKAGYYAWVSHNHFLQTKYHDIADIEHVSALSYDQTKKDVSKLFFNAVGNQLVSDVPLAIFLSGGIDSSAIVAAASQISASKVNTFSISFQEKKYDESHYARFIAKKYNTEHHECVVPATIFIDQIEDALNVMSTPSGDGPNTYLISNLVRQSGIKVALSGLGGDELFAGYNHFKTYYQLNKFQDKLPNWFRQSLGNLFIKSGNRKVQKVAELFIKPTFDIAYVYPTFRRIFSVEDYIKLNPILKMYDDTVESGLLWDSEQINKLPLLSRFSVAELKNYTPNVLLEDADQMSMANSIELRVPFLDKDLVKYILAVPDKYKFPSTPKKLLVDSLSPLIPDEIVNRPKMGFSFPWDLWMKNELKEFCQQRIYSLAERGLFNSDEVVFLWKSFISGNKQTPWFKIWLLVVLEHWIERNGVS